MPTQRINACDPHTLADILVGWNTQDELHDQQPHLPLPEDPYVELFPVAPAAISGGIMLCPNEESKDALGLHNGDTGIGPVRVKMDRTSVNKLITVLRQARDEAFGADA